MTPIFIPKPPEPRAMNNSRGGRNDMGAFIERPYTRRHIRIDPMSQLEAELADAKARIAQLEGQVTGALSRGSLEVEHLVQRVRTLEENARSGSNTFRARLDAPSIEDNKAAAGSPGQPARNPGAFG